MEILQVIRLHRGVQGWEGVGVQRTSVAIHGCYWECRRQAWWLRRCPMRRRNCCDSHVVSRGHSEFAYALTCQVWEYSDGLFYSSWSVAPPLVTIYYDSYPFSQGPLPSRPCNRRWHVGVGNRPPVKVIRSLQVPEACELTEGGPESNI